MKNDAYREFSNLIGIGEKELESLLADLETVIDLWKAAGGKLPETPIPDRMGLTTPYRTQAVLPPKDYTDLFLNHILPANDHLPANDPKIYAVICGTPEYKILAAVSIKEWEAGNYDAGERARDNALILYLLSDERNRKLTRPYRAMLRRNQAEVDKLTDEKKRTQQGLTPCGREIGRKANKARAEKQRKEIRKLFIGLKKKCPGTSLDDLISKVQADPHHRAVLLKNPDKYKDMKLEDISPKEKAFYTTDTLKKKILIGLFD